MEISILVKAQIKQSSLTFLLEGRGVLIGNSSDGLRTPGWVGQKLACVVSTSNNNKKINLNYKNLSDNFGGKRKKFQIKVIEKEPYNRRNCLGVEEINNIFKKIVLIKQKQKLTNRKGFFLNDPSKKIIHILFEHFLVYA